MKALFLTVVSPIAAIFSFRMLGLFMLIPVFSVYATHLDGATPALIGLALGGYGLSQGLLQIPFGLLSDRYGRKPLLTIGLVIFAAGSLLGALSHSITGMIIARIIQGMGAIGGVLIALLADLTPDRQRTLAMAVIGGSIGASFGLAFIISPILVNYTGLSGIFYFTTALALSALILLHTVIPTPKAAHVIHRKNHRQRLKEVILNPELQRLNVGIFCLHLILTSTFFAVPLRLQDAINASVLHTAWHFYLPILGGAFILMLPLIFIAEKKQQSKRIFIGAVLTIACCQAGLLCESTSWFAFSGFIFLYFVAFNILEAMLPSMISKQASTTHKGAAMGVYSSSQFLGIFAGGSLSGVLYQAYGSVGIFLTNVGVALLWLIIASSMTIKNKPRSRNISDELSNEP